MYSPAQWRQSLLRPAAVSPSRMPERLSWATDRLPQRTWKHVSSSPMEATSAPMTGISWSVGTQSIPFMAAAHEASDQTE